MSKLHLLFYKRKEDYLKIYLDYTKTKSITEKGYLKLKERFNEFVWTDKLEDSYDADVILVMPTENQ